MRLYELPGYREPRPKIYGLNPGGYGNGVVEFDHIDGAYSFCLAYDNEGAYLGLVHLAAWTPLEPFEDGYRVAAERDSEGGE